MDLSLSMWRGIPELVRHHVKGGTANYPMGIYITLVHILASVGVCYVRRCKPETLLFSVVLWWLSGFGITVGVHRLWSHRSYTAALPLRVLLMIWNSIANQGSIYHWARDHRVHHKFSETDADPHNATRGFFFAHMGWLYVKKHKRVVEAGRDLNFDDLKADPVVTFQRRLDPWWALYCCFVMPAQVASYFWSENFWTAFFVAGALRYCIVLHFTWFVNSAAHMYGDHPYDPLSYPAENPIVSLCAVGEGWHNYHHKYPYDYSCSEHGFLLQFNPSTMFIDLCAYLGLVKDRKKATGAWNMAKNKRIQDAKNGTLPPKAPPRPWDVKKA